MTSLIRNTTDSLKHETKYTNITTPTYSNGGDTLPIPFLVKSNQLDINIDNAAVQTMITNGTIGNGKSQYQVRMMSGPRTVVTLSTRMKTWLNNYFAVQFSKTHGGTPTVTVNPVMVKVQIADPVLNYNDAVEWTTLSPGSDNYVSGEATNNYYTAWVFKSPITIRFEDSAVAGGYRYLTLMSQFDVT